MDRRTFITSTAAASTALVLPALAGASAPDPLRGAAWVHVFPESGLYEVVAVVETSPHESLPGRIELVRQDGLVLNAVQVPKGARDGWFAVKTRSRFGRQERVGLRLHPSYLMTKVEGYDARLPDHLSGEPYGVYVRDPDRRRAAQQAREFATQLDRTLYLGRDRHTGDHLAISGDAGRVPFRDRHYGEAPIPPRGNYWEPRLIEEGRAPWL